MPPQMYFVLDNHSKLKSLLEKQNIERKIIIHNHDEIYYDILAMAVSGKEMIKKQQLLQESRNDFSNIKY